MDVSNHFFLTGTIEVLAQVKRSARIVCFSVNGVIDAQAAMTDIFSGEAIHTTFGNNDFLSTFGVIFGINHIRHRIHLTQGFRGTIHPEYKVVFHVFRAGVIVLEANLLIT